MVTFKHNQLSWVSLILLLITYIWFGWYLCGLEGKPLWLNSACYRLFGAPISPSFQITQAPEISAQHKKPAANSNTSGSTESHSREAQPHGDLAQKGSEQQEPLSLSRSICGAVMKYNLVAGVLAIAWIGLSSIAFISPLTSFSSFINRWFQSETIAFLTIFLLAGLAAVILYWLHIFLQILTILAVDILARIDIQYAGLTGIQAFWILTLVSLTGLVLGWTAHALILSPL